MENSKKVASPVGYPSIHPPSEVAFVVTRGAAAPGTRRRRGDHRSSSSSSSSFSYGGAESGTAVVRALSLDQEDDHDDDHDDDCSPLSSPPNSPTYQRSLYRVSPLSSLNGEEEVKVLRGGDEATRAAASGTGAVATATTAVTTTPQKLRDAAPFDEEGPLSALRARGAALVAATTTALAAEEDDVDALALPSCRISVGRGGGGGGVDVDAATRQDSRRCPLVVDGRGELRALSLRARRILHNDDDLVAAAAAGGGKGSHTALSHSTTRAASFATPLPFEDEEGGNRGNVLALRDRTSSSSHQEADEEKESDAAGPEDEGYAARVCRDELDRLEVVLAPTDEGGGVFVPRNGDDLQPTAASILNDEDHDEGSFSSLDKGKPPLQSQGPNSPSTTQDATTTEEYDDLCLGYEQPPPLASSIRRSLMHPHREVSQCQEFDDFLPTAPGAASVSSSLHLSEARGLEIDDDHYDPRTSRLNLVGDDCTNGEGDAVIPGVRYPSDGMYLVPPA